MYITLTLFFPFVGQLALSMDILEKCRGVSPKLSRFYIRLGKQFKINHMQEFGPSHMQKSIFDAYIDCMEVLHPPNQLSSTVIESITTQK